MHYEGIMRGTKHLFIWSHLMVPVSSVTLNTHKRCLQVCGITGLQIELGAVPQALSSLLNHESKQQQNYCPDDADEADDGRPMRALF